MSRSFTRGLRGFLSLVVILSGLNSIAWCQQPTNQPPQAFVVAFQEYDKQPDKNLKHALESGCALVKALSANGIGVTFYVDANSKDAAEAEMAKVEEKKKNSARPGMALKPGVITVKIASTAEELENQFGEWTDSHFAELSSGAGSRTPFGLFAYVGHGIQRNGRDFILTPSDTFEDGGLPVSSLLTRNNGSRPIVYVFDMCRNEAGKDASEENEKPTMLPVSPVSGRDRALALFSTLPGQVVPDTKDNLTRLLAEGLEHVEKPTPSFRAKRQSPLGQATLGLYESDSELPVAVWFNYAIVNRVTDSINTNSFELYRGKVDQSMVIASRNPRYSYEVPIDLMPDWNAFALSGSVVTTVGNGMVRFDRSDLEGGFATSFLGTTEDGTAERTYDPKGKVLYLELHAEAPPGTAGGGFIVCNITPGNNKVMNGELVKNVRLSRAIPYGTTIPMVIPFDAATDGKVLNAVAIGTAVDKPEGWAPGAALVVTRLVLVDPATQGKLKPFVPEGNVLRRVWINSKLPSERSRDVKVYYTREASEDAAAARKETADADEAKGEPVKDKASKADDRKIKDFILAIQSTTPEAGTMLGVQGPIYPPLAVSPNVVVEANLGKVTCPPGEKTCDVCVTFFSEGVEVGTATFEVSPKSTRQPRVIELKKECLCDSLTVTTDAADLEITSLELRPANAGRRK